MLKQFALSRNRQRSLTQSKKQEKKLKQKFSRAKESAADRIPAACDCLETSYYVWQDKKNMYLKDGNEGGGSHPTHESRLQWSEKIYRLRLAMEGLPQPEPTRLNLDDSSKLPKSTFIAKNISNITRNDFETV